MNDTKFKVGDEVRLIKNPCMSAPKGSIAIVTGYWECGIKVKWVTKTTQANGGYSPNKFELINKQLLFDFMYD